MTGFGGAWPVQPPQWQYDVRLAFLPSPDEIVWAQRILSAGGECARRTFTDRLPTVADPYARRTRRVGEIVGLLGHSAGGRPGERLMQRLGMPVSDDPILRQL
jgi:hypothetical protein